MGALGLVKFKFTAETQRSLRKCRQAVTDLLWYGRLARALWPEPGGTPVPLKSDQ